MTYASRAAIAVLSGGALFLTAAAQSVPPMPAKPIDGTASTAPQLGAQIATILSAPPVARDHWGIQVTTLDGTPLCSLNETQLFRPASNAKLFTTAAALALLGPTHQLQTTVTGKLDLKTGTVRGDITLAGGGDANFGSSDLPYIAPADRPKGVSREANSMQDIQNLVAQLKMNGVRQIAGDIVGDDTAYPWQPYPEGWSVDDMVWGYGAPVTALTIADNQLRITIAPGAAIGQPATVTLEQAADYYSIQNDTHTVATKSQATGVQIERTPGSRVLHLYGFLARGDNPDAEHVAIDDPAQYAAMVLREQLLTQGIEVKGVATAHHRLQTRGLDFASALHQPGMEDEIARGIYIESNCFTELPTEPQPAILATVDSKPLADDVLFTNKASQNLHAELFLHQLGSMPQLCGDGSALGGARLVRAFLLHAGLDANDFIFYDGSGLSTHDLVTPRAVAKLLTYAAHDPKTTQPQPWFAVWKSSLPIGAEDGTLASRFPKAPLKDHVFAKTGTLGESRALSGYLDAASGRTVIFSILVDNHLPNTSDDRDAMDKIVAAIQASE